MIETLKSMESENRQLAQKCDQLRQERDSKTIQLASADENIKTLQQQVH